MHTCYSRIALVKLLSIDSQITQLTRLLLPLHSQRISSAEQMGKRECKEVWEEYKYSPHKYIAVGGRKHFLRGHRTLRCQAPDAPVPCPTATAHRLFTVTPDAPVPLTGQSGGCVRDSVRDQHPRCNLSVTTTGPSEHIPSASGELQRTHLLTKHSPDAPG